jgi:hypothetical protein
MKLTNKIYFILFVLLLFSCTEEERKLFELTSTGSGVIEICNNGENTAQFSLIVNNKDLGSQKKIAMYILKMEEEYTDEPIWMKAFRFVCKNTWHDELVTRYEWAYSPFVLVNSLGGGMCGFRSAVLTNILKELGMEARSWSLNGHVVTEVNTGHKWILLDPDLGVYYYNSNNEIASYLEICSNPELITHPCSPVLNSESKSYIRAYSNETSALYSSINDNEEFVTDFPEELKTTDLIFSIPAGGIFTFPFNKRCEGNFYAYSELKLPDGYTGKIKIPLVIAGIVGFGDVKYQNEIFSIEDFDFKKNVLDNHEMALEIEIIENRGGVKIYYFVNPLVYDFIPDSKILLKGRNLEKVEIKYSENADLVISKPFAEDTLYKKIEEITVVLTDSLKNTNATIDYKFLKFYFDMIIKELENDDAFSNQFEKQKIYFEIDKLLVNFSKEPNADYSVFLNSEFVVPTLCKIIKKSNNEKEVF